MIDDSSRSSMLDDFDITFWAGFGCLGLVAVAIVGDALISPPGQSLTREGGALEMSSALLYFLAAGMLGIGLGRSARWQFGVILIAMGLRELDVDKRFTSEGILSTKIFVYDTPIWEKVLAAFVLTLVVGAVASFAIQGSATFLRAVRRGEGWPRYVVGAVALTVISKSIDGLSRKLAPYGISVSDGVNTLSGKIEEVLELGIPILLIMAIVELSRRPGRAPSI